MDERKSYPICKKYEQACPFAEKNGECRVNGCVLITLGVKDVGDVE